MPTHSFTGNDEALRRHEARLIARSIDDALQAANGGHGRAITVILLVSLIPQPGAEGRPTTFPSQLRARP